MGFGVRRLPLADDAAGIDEAGAIKLVRGAIDQGVNYLDLGCPYDMSWYQQLSAVINRALSDGYRQKVKIAAALPSFLVNAPADFDSYLDNQLDWLGMERIDFYLLGDLNRESWPKIRELGVLDRAEKAVNSGRVGHLGFSLHDSFQVLRGVLGDYDNWALAQFQYSYMDVDRLPGVSGLRLAADNGLAVVAAEPLKRGRLAKEPPEAVAKIWADARWKRSLAEWGLRWVWNHPEIATVVCDMATTGQVMENAALAERAEPDSLTVPEEVLISQIREAYRKLRPVPCTACRGCMPCPQDIDVPRILEIFNDAVIYDDVETARQIYRAEKHNLDDCSECGICVCGREIDILNWLEKARRLFA